MTESRRTSLPLAYANHGRSWRNNAYCYPVVSRRSGGLSIGINLNPDKACNFDCVYCQVDRTRPPTIRQVDLARLRVELEAMVEGAIDGSLFDQAPFDALSPENRSIRDLAFSGDGEPTTYPKFAEAVEVAADVRRQRGLNDAKIVLITDACYLTRPDVRTGLDILDRNNGEIWAKLDAGTEQYYQAVNRPNYPLDHVLDNILDAARVRPIVIQSLWMRLHGEPPPDDEISAFSARLNDIQDAGGRIKLIQIYTIARKTTEPYATALSNSELDRLASIIDSATSIPHETFYGTGVS